MAEAVTLTEGGVYRFSDGTCVPEEEAERAGLPVNRETARTHTLSWQILKAHNTVPDMEALKLRFDALVSPDNNYVNILQTARASGLKAFPVPYILSNCHNTLCAVGGTINEDDHRFGLDNAKKYGGIYLPPYRGVLHQYMREQYAGCGKMILGSDSHTRYGALGTMGIGEGGGELVKQLLGHTYDITRPPVILIHVTGALKHGIGPMDAALSIIGKTFRNGFHKNKILEFAGPGIHNLSVETRMGIDVMMTESAALSSIWETDDKVRLYLETHGRKDAYAPLKLTDSAYYDGMVELNLSEVEPMMALPYHPSNVVSIQKFNEDPAYYLGGIEEEGNRIKAGRGKPFMVKHMLVDGKFRASQALVSGCAGGLYENIAAMADILEDYTICADGAGLGINPASQPVNAALMRAGILNRLMLQGATIRPCICGPCFGVTDVPADNTISIRHMTRNYPNRDGSKPAQGQMSADILMDARSIAATVRNGGFLTPATQLQWKDTCPPYVYESEIYEKQVYQGFGKAQPETKLRMGPNIADWPPMAALGKHLLLKAAGVYQGSVTTDELIPSGEPSSYRSNPEKLASYTMCGKDPGYVKKAKAIKEGAENLIKTGLTGDKEADEILESLCRQLSCMPKDVTYGSLMASDEIGDGSSREQAASCQKVLGGFANLACAYATKRYRSNLINWGILPLEIKEMPEIKEGDYLLIENVQEKIRENADGKKFPVKLLKHTMQLNAAKIMENSKAAEDDKAARNSKTADNSKKTDGNTEEMLFVSIGKLTAEEQEILLAGCLMNYYQQMEAEGKTNHEMLGVPT